METLLIKSHSFIDQGRIPIKYTGWGDDISPGFELENIDNQAKTIAIIMDDLDIPFIKAYTHWVIWNIPVQSSIPENIPHGASIQEPFIVKQGIGYGKHRYRGPKPPIFIRNKHRYQFQIYVLDTWLEISEQSKKADILSAMTGHILQQGSITGYYQNGQKE